MIQFLKDSICEYIRFLIPYFTMVFATFCTLIMIASLFGAFYAVYIFDIKLTALAIGGTLISFISASVFFKVFLKLMD